MGSTKSVWAAMTSSIYERFEDDMNKCLTGKPSRTARIRIVSAAMAAAVLLATGACFSSDDPEPEESVPPVLAYEHPCEILDVSNAPGMVFGADSATVDWSEEATGKFSECYGYLPLMEGGEKVGRIDFIARIFDASDLDPEDSHGGFGRFQLSGQAKADEILDWMVRPITTRWGSGETYALDGFYYSQDVYIVGGWAKAEDFAVGINFRFAADAENYAEDLIYHQYCDTTDLASDCLISSDVLHQWMSTDYIRALFDRLTEVASG